MRTEELELLEEIHKDSSMHQVVVDTKHNKVKIQRLVKGLNKLHSRMK